MSIDWEPLKSILLTIEVVFLLNIWRMERKRYKQEVMRRNECILRTGHKNELDALLAQRQARHKLSDDDYPEK